VSKKIKRIKDMRKRILVLLMMWMVLCKAQQDPQYNLYQFNQMVINPAYAGARNALAIVADVRNQWVGINGAPKTNCLSIHAPIANNRLGLGLTLVNDGLGPRISNGVYGNVAYILPLNNRWKLSAGIGVGLLSYRFDFNKLNFKTTEVNTQLYESQRLSVLDLSGGIYLRTEKFFLGISSTHLSSPSVYRYNNTIGSISSSVSYKLQNHTFITMGRSFMLSEKVVFAPSITARIIQSGNADLNLNFFLFKKLWLGAFVRSNFGTGMLLQYYITNQFRVGYSYDSGLGDARRLGASHEIMIGFDINTKKAKVISPRFL
jgi:type IX secretion system PorP/SprF family membrane protein